MNLTPNKLIIRYLINLKVFSVLFLGSFSIFSKNDSINIKKVDFFKNRNNDSLKFYAKKLGSSHNICTRIEGLTAKAYSLYREKNYLESEKLSKVILNKIDSITIEDGYSKCLISRKIAALNRLFWIKKNQEEYEDAYNYLNEVNATNETYKEKGILYYRHRISLKNSMGLIQNMLNMPEEAKSKLLEALSDFNKPMFDNLKNEYFFILSKAQLLYSIGTTYLTISKQKENPILIDSAKVYFDNAYKTVQNLKPEHKDSEIIYNFRKTEVLIAKKEYKKALKLINNYKNINNGYNYYHYEFFQKAICYYNLKKADSTLFYAHKIIKDQEKCKRSNLITMYDILSNQYYNIKKIDSAYKYSKLTLKQFNLAETSKEKTFQLLYKNDFEKAKQLNQLIKQQEVKNKNRSTIYLVSLLFILSLSSLYFFNIKKKTKEKIEVLQTNSSNDSIKAEYNINENFEKDIIVEINRMDTNLEFLKPEFSVSYLADKLQTNSTYISFIFNKNKGKTFKQYYTKKKLDFLIEKLKTDEIYRKYSIQGLAEEIGYSNASTFARAFKKEFGITPSAFLKTLNDN